ncbi:late embryogenesis abundant protein D-29 isoform X1 [Sesamum indicum]|uniref:Late embryogenesis abundant protein D-29 isoform X1 n=1 Tax=Sesamum indicum TaxID=4182 RepID=A0A6I9UJV3_SESIN|nr:late embryogenesis abundant protein D-29 isoform X1 [Sesamum indicum]
MKVRFVVVVLLVIWAVVGINGKENPLLHEEGAAAAGKESSSESWAEWAKEKIAEGLGFNHAAKHTSTSDAAKNTKDKITQATTAAEYGSDVKKGAAEKAGEARDKASEAADEVKRKASQKTEEAYERMGQAKEMAAEKARQGKEAAREEAREKEEKAEEKLKWAKEKAKEGYEAAKEKVGEGYESARDTIASNLEAAKEKSRDIKEDMTTTTTMGGRDEEL